MQRLTAEISEKCLELKSVEILGRTGTETFNGDGRSEIQCFKNHVLASETLRAGLHRVICAVFDEQRQIVDHGSAGIEHVGKLLKTGKLISFYSAIRTTGAWIIAKSPVPISLLRHSKRCCRHSFWSEAILREMKRFLLERSNSSGNEALVRLLSGPRETCFAVAFDGCIC